MIVLMSMLLVYALISLILSIIILIFSWWLLWFYFVVFFVFMALFFLAILYPHEVWWKDDRDSFWSIIFRYMLFIIISIIIYSFIYYKFWLFMINWELQKITYYESLYFSISMWINLWYSYILPIKEIALITSLEAINWYLSFAFLVAMFSIWFNDVITSLKEVTRHNRNLIKHQKIQDNNKRKEKSKRNKNKKNVSWKNITKKQKWKQ